MSVRPSFSPPSNQDPIPPKFLGVILAGSAALAAALGIGRFVYTPILPFMIEALDLSKSEAGLIASANYVGYLAGALMAAWFSLPGRRRTWVVVSLALTVLSTAAMAYTTSIPLYLFLRLISGITGAFVMVYASAIVLDRLAASGHGHLSHRHFAGVGIGITLSALLVAGLAALSIAWGGLWIGSAALALVALAITAWLLPHQDHVARDQPTHPASPMNRSLLLLLISYTLVGFGYVITATFISAIVRATPDLQPIEPAIWAVVGLAVVPSITLWSWTGRRFGFHAAFALACLAEAVGVALSVLSTEIFALILSAILLGGTFIAITAIGLVIARDMTEGDSRRPLGMMTAAWGLGQMIGPVFAGTLSDRLGNFTAASLCATAALVVAAGLAMTARPASSIGRDA